MESFMENVLVAFGLIFIVITLLSFPIALIRRKIDQKRFEEAQRVHHMQRALENNAQEAAYWRNVERQAQSGNVEAQQELSNKRHADYLARQIALNTPPPQPPQQ